MLEATVARQLKEDLEAIVGKDYVTTSKADLYIYSQDLTQAKPEWPDVVVLPASLEELRKVVIMANREKIPVTPYVAGGNIGGLAIPLEGGILLDLTVAVFVTGIIMDRIQRAFDSLDTRKLTVLRE